MIFFFSFSFFCLIFLTDKLNDERTTFPVKTLRLLQPRRASQPSIKTIDLLHTLDLSYILRLVLHNHFILFLFLRSLCAALTPPPAPPPPPSPRSSPSSSPSPPLSPTLTLTLSLSLSLYTIPLTQTCTAVAELHIERVGGPSSQSREFH